MTRGFLTAPSEVIPSAGPGEIARIKVKREDESRGADGEIFFQERLFDL